MLRIILLLFCSLVTSGLSFATNPDKDLCPRQIHYIWVGGPIYQEYWNDLTTLASLTHAEGYQVNLWLETPRHARFTREMVVKSQGWYELAESNRNVLVNETYRLYVDQLKWITLCDVREMRDVRLESLSEQEHRDLWRYIDAERHGLKNLGAYSDILRLLIVGSIGGLYLDTDSTPLVSTSYLDHDNRPAFLGDLLTEDQDFLCFGDGNSILAGRPNNQTCASAIRKIIDLYRTYEKLPHPLAQVNTRPENTNLPGLDAKRLLPRGKQPSDIRDTDRGCLTIHFTGPSLLQLCIQPACRKPDFKTVNDNEYFPLAVWKAKKELDNVASKDRVALYSGPMIIEGPPNSVQEMIMRMRGLPYDSYDAKSGQHLARICRYLLDDPKLCLLEGGKLEDVREWFSLIRRDGKQGNIVKLGSKMILEYKCDCSWNSKGNPKALDDASIDLPTGQYLYRYSQPNLANDGHN